ncbi:MAG: flagellar biosynthesis protein FliQ [Spirochaetaceae bacterium]|nr:flagellar biosynthesis protein FliQ [Spirochaetaceae bacterium]MBR4012345.1 flagellar biosynthesis protein FliQ [Spirochaetaceae bacterium]
MSLGTVTALIRDGVFLVLKLSSPILIAALVVGLIVAIIQAVTSIQEQTLTFVPKLLVILIALVLLGSWMFASLRSYTVSLFEMIPDMAR